MKTLYYRQLWSRIPPSAITSALCTFSVGFIFLYVYFVAASVLHVVVRQDSESKAAVLMSEIATLETTLIAAQHTISDRLGTLQGFKGEQEKVFVNKSKDSGLVLGDGVR